MSESIISFCKKTRTIYISVSNIHFKMLICVGVVIQQTFNGQYKARLLPFWWMILFLVLMLGQFCEQEFHSDQGPWTQPVWQSTEQVSTCDGSFRPACPRHKETSDFDPPFTHCKPLNEWRNYLNFLFSDEIPFMHCKSLCLEEEK
jgi:hypothetical protein